MNSGYDIASILLQLLGIGFFALLLLYILRFYQIYAKEMLVGEVKLTLGLSVIVGLGFCVLFISQLQMAQYFFAVMLSLMLAFSLLHPVFAMTSVLALLILRPWELRPDLEVLTILPRAVFVIFIVSWLLQAIRRKNFRINRDANQWWILGLGGLVFLSTFVSGNMAEAQSNFFETYFKCLVVGIMLFQVMEKDEDYDTMSSGLLIAVLGLALAALIYTFTGLESGARLEGQGAFSNANDIAAILIFVLPFGLRSLFQKKWNVFSLALSVLVLGCLMLGVWKSQSRAAYLSVFLMAVSYFVYRFRSRRKLLIQLGVAVLPVILVVSQLKLGRDSSDLEESRMNRLGYWKAGISMAFRNPLLGVGFGQFPNNYQYYDAAEFTEHGKRTAHSSWILLLAEAGFPALILVLGLFAKAFKKAWSLMPVRPELLLCLVGYGVTMSFLSHIYVLYPYLLLALVLSYPDLKSQKSPSV